MTIGANIRRARQAANLSRADLAQLMDKASTRRIEQWETDRRAMTRASALNLCRALEISENELLGVPRTALYRVRRQLSVPLTQLANLMCTEIEVVWLWDRGLRRPSPATLMLLASALGVSASDIDDSVLPEGSFAARVRQLRIEYFGGSRSRMSAAVGVPARVLRRYESEARIPRWPTIIQISHCLGWTPSQLLDGVTT
jgi:transcriptional regulator with XRE-family HTH domain